MRVQFSKQIVYTPEWNGNKELPPADRVTVDLKVLEFNDLLKLIDVFQNSKTDDGKNVDQMKIVSEAFHLIPKYAVINNLFDNDGPVTSETVPNYGLYLPLCSEILTQLSKISMPTESDEKNSVTPPG